MGDDVDTAGAGVGDMVEAIKRGARGVVDGAAEAVTRIRDAYAAAQARRALNLAMIIAAAYLLLRKRR